MRVPGCAANSREREEDERIFPPHRLHEAMTENTSNAREHATTSLVFGGWRCDDREDDDRDDDDRDHGDREGIKKAAREQAA